MGLYDVERVIHDMNVNAALTERFREAPQAVLADYALDDSERAALVDGDVAALWTMGVHPLLMLHYARARRVPMPEFYGALKPLEGQRKMVSARGS
jgi:Aromatic-ring-opening dioxygenase LigAB, LigA subunit